MLSRLPSSCFIKNVLWSSLNWGLFKPNAKGWNQHEELEDLGMEDVCGEEDQGGKDQMEEDWMEYQVEEGGSRQED